MLQNYFTVHTAGCAGSNYTIEPLVVPLVPKTISTLRQEQVASCKKAYSECVAGLECNLLWQFQDSFGSHLPSL